MLHVHRATIMAALAFLLPAPVVAQELPQNAAIPDLERAPPTADPTAVPIPLATPLPVPTATPARAPAPLPTPTSTPRPKPSPFPASAPTATPTPAATAAARERATALDRTPVPSPPAPPPAVIAPVPIGDHPGDIAGGAGWPWMLGVAIVVLGGLGLWLARRRRIAGEVPEPERLLPTPRATPVPSATIPPAARLTIGFRPARAGFNMLSATVEGEVTIANEGAGPATDIRIRTALLSAHEGQDADLAAFVGEAIGRPDTAPFALIAGERRVVRVVAASPRDSLQTMVAVGRPMFVPVLAVNVQAAQGQVAQAFAVGIERVDSAKLAPFWLDVPPRSYDQVAARPHGPVTARLPNG